MSSILAKVGLTASASLVLPQCRSSIASFELLARCFHSSQSWYIPYKDRAAKNAKAREKYASDPEYRKRQIQLNAERNRQRYHSDPVYRKRNHQYTIESRAKKRPIHIQNYLNDAEYRDSVRQERFRLTSSASRQRDYGRRKENINNCYQKNALSQWVLKGEWRRRLFWETHEPLVFEEHHEKPGLCATCNGAFTRRLWWRRKKAGEKSAENTDEQSSEQMLDCHSCFCDKDWEKALPLGYRGHVFGRGTRLKQPDWDNYPPPSPSPSP